MQIISKEELLLNKDLYFAKILKGATFVYPTDTIYAFGCSAMLPDAVQKIREAKQRLNRPFSVIAPSKDWILKHCEVGKIEQEWLDKLPGPYTLILKRKNLNCVAENVNSADDTIGVRIPDHWMANVIEELGVPVMTPSANPKGMNFMTCLDDMHQDIKAKTDFLIDDGPIKGHPSTLVNLSKGGEEITPREK